MAAVQLSQDGSTLFGIMKYLTRITVVFPQPLDFTNYPPCHFPSVYITQRLQELVSVLGLAPVTCD